MNSMITFVIMNWSRTENTKKLTAALKNQSIDTQVFVFNNNPEIDYEDSNADLVISSNKNLRCGACWMPMMYAFDGVICKIDDDLIPNTTKFAEETVETLNNLEKTYGSCNVALGVESEFWASNGHGMNYNEDGEVDCIKGRVMVFRRGLLNDFPIFKMLNLENEQYHHGELSFAAFLKEQGKILYNSTHVRSMLEDVDSHSSKAAHAESTHYSDRIAIRKKLYSKVRS